MMKFIKKNTEIEKENKRLDKENNLLLKKITNLETQYEDEKSKELAWSNTEEEKY